MCAPSPEDGELHSWGTDQAACKNPAGVSVGLGRPRAGAVPRVPWPGTCSAVNGLYALV